MTTLKPQLPATMYVVKRLMKRADTSMGLEISIANESMGICGALLVFESIEAAERHYGVGVETIEIELAKVW